MLTFTYSETRRMQGKIVMLVNSTSKVDYIY